MLDHRYKIVSIINYESMNHKNRISADFHFHISGISGFGSDGMADKCQGKRILAFYLIKCFSRNWKIQFLISSRQDTIKGRPIMGFTDYFNESICIGKRDKILV